MHEAVYFAIKDSLLKNDKPREMVLETRRNFTQQQLYGVQPDSGVQMKFACADEKPVQPKPQPQPTAAYVPPPQESFDTTPAAEKAQPTVKSVVESVSNAVAQKEPEPAKPQRASERSPRRRTGSATTSRPGWYRGSGSRHSSRPARWP